jgi:hypothetical protein
VSQWTTEQLQCFARMRAHSGLGTCCAEAQADGVPCTTLGRACEECERAARVVWALDTKSMATVSKAGAA